MDILIATQNPGKFKEIYEVLESLPAKFYSLSDFGIREAASEEGQSFSDVALGKARFYAKKSGLVTLADDSGIIVEALAGELGLRTRRWGAGEKASDEEWMAHFMQRMAAERNRRAKFVCAAALVMPSSEKVFLGETEGVISEQLEAPIQPGIPLSSVFKPVGYDVVYAALPVSEKNGLSHRGKAFIQALEHLKLHYDF